MMVPPSVWEPALVEKRLLSRRTASKVTALRRQLSQSQRSSKSGALKSESQRYQPQLKARAKLVSSSARTGWLVCRGVLSISPPGSETSGIGGSAASSAARLIAAVEGRNITLLRRGDEQE